MTDNAKNNWRNFLDESRAALAASAPFIEQACEALIKERVAELERQLAAERARHAGLREAVIEECAKVAERIGPCPFDSKIPPRLEPEDPCPVCGDKGDDVHAPSHCRSAVVAIRALKALASSPSGSGKGREEEMSNWRPIEGATGLNRILACFPHGSVYVVCIARWNPSARRWFDTEENSCVAWPNGNTCPAYFQPLPEPPQ